MLHHGGKLIQEARKRNSDPKEWLDLSTGISPISYPSIDIPQQVWHRLPEEEDGLVAAAQQYYGYPDLLPVAGSQAAIMALPRVIETQLGYKGCVLLPQRGYQEHHGAWQRAGWCIEFYQHQPLNAQLSCTDVVVLINPNNPTTVKHSGQAVAQLESQLTTNQILIIDEAFMDGDDEASRLRSKLRSNTIVFRSLGKFFGLAGLRVGFVAADEIWRAKLNAELGPWTLSGPSRYLATQALLDKKWQHQVATRLTELKNEQLALLMQFFSPESVRSASLFIRIEHPQAEALYQYCCEQLLLVRLCDEKDAIRLGLCGDKSSLIQMQQALHYAIDKLEKYNHSDTVTRYVE